MVRMSLIPSESASFPDLVGQVHGYRHPNARRPSLRQKATRSPSSPPQPTNADNDRVVLEPVAPLVCPEPLENPEDNRGALEIPAPPNSPPPSTNPANDSVVLEPLTPLDSPESAENPEDNRAAVQSENEPRRTADSNPPEEQTIAPEKGPPEQLQLFRTALPTLPQRSVAQMRSKIEPQETAPPVRAKRPRTPVRGLTINRPAPFVVEKPAHPLSARFPLLNLPRHRLVKLIRFIVCETLAVGILVLAMMFGFAHQFANDPLSLVLKVLAVVAAVAAILVPVIFYGLPAIFPRSQR
jgi:hypothetical protein